MNVYARKVKVFGEVRSARIAVKGTRFSCRRREGTASNDQHRSRWLESTMWKSDLPRELVPEKRVIRVSWKNGTCCS